MFYNLNKDDIAPHLRRPTSPLRQGFSDIATSKSPLRGGQTVTFKRDDLLSAKSALPTNSGLSIQTP